MVPLYVPTLKPAELAVTARLVDWPASSCPEVLERNSQLLPSLVERLAFQLRGCPPVFCMVIDCAAGFWIGVPWKDSAALEIIRLAEGGLTPIVTVSVCG